MEAMALIEIDGLPINSMGGSFHGELLVITRWYMIYISIPNGFSPSVMPSPSRCPKSALLPEGGRKHGGKA